MKTRDKIKKLKIEKNAVILAHNYQLPEIQDIADFVGDSLGLSIEASKTNAEVIVFCGVHFMAETAKILSPQKTVLLPDKGAGCPMADMINTEGLQSLQSKHPNAVTMCYVNSSAAVKALCDYCCTSANALKMTQNILPRNKEIIFVPDRYLAQYVAGMANCNFITWEGYCPIHAEISPDDMMRSKSLHPKAKVIVHPECKPIIMDFADIVASTEGMSKYIKNSKEKEFIIGTEIGIIHRLKKKIGQDFLSRFRYGNLLGYEKINLEKVLWSLEQSSYEISLPENIIDRARTSINRMLQII